MSIMKFIKGCWSCLLIVSLFSLYNASASSSTTGSKIALISSSDRMIPGYESGNWSNLNEFWEDWKFILNENNW